MLIESTLFESFISLVILVNAGLVGVQLSLELQQKDGGIPFDTLEYTFLAIYTMELLMRCYAYGLKRQVTELPGAQRRMFEFLCFVAT